MIQDGPTCLQHPMNACYIVSKQLFGKPQHYNEVSFSTFNRKFVIECMSLMSNYALSVLYHNVIALVLLFISIRLRSRLWYTRPQFHQILHCTQLLYLRDSFVNSHAVFTFQCLSPAIFSQSVLWYSCFTDQLFSYSSESTIPATDKIWEVCR